MRNLSMSYYQLKDFQQARYWVMEMKKDFEAAGDTEGLKKVDNYLREFDEKKAALKGTP